MMKITISNKNHKNFGGICQGQDRNYSEEIIVYKNSPDKLRTLIHELIHFTFFELQDQGHSSRMLTHVNEDERLICQMADNIKEGLSKIFEIKMRRQNE